MMESMSSPKDQVLIVIGATHRFSHLEKVIVIGAHLVKRGYNVTILAGEAVRAQIESIGASFVPMQGRAGFSRSKSEPHQPPPPFTKEVEISAIKRFFLDCIPDQYKTVQTLLKSIRQTYGDQRKVIYMDDIICGAMLPVYFGAPGAIKPKGVIAIGTTPCPHEIMGATTWASGVSFDSTTADSVKQLWATKKEIYHSDEIQVHFEKALHEAGVHKSKTTALPRFLNSQGTSCDIYLALSIPGFEYQGVHIPDNIRFVGGLPTVGSAPSSLPGWWDETINPTEGKKRPIVVVSQGAVNNDPKDLILPTIEALRDEDVTVIATLNKGPRLEIQLPSNVKLADFIPFDILLRHTDVLVSNGGFGTAQMALSLGVPMVLAGLYFDKAYTNFRAASMGAAINLECEKADSNQVKKAVYEILSNPRIKEQCLEIKGRYAEYDTLDQIVRLVNELAEK